MKKTKANRAMRKRNPVFNQLHNARRIPRPRVSFDGTIIKGTLSVAANVTGSNKGLDYHLLNADLGVGIARVNKDIMDRYQQYRYLSAKVTWIPNVSPGEADARSQIIFATLFNPEEIFWVTQTATSSTIFGQLVAVKNNLTFNAWERCTYNIPMFKRKPWFDCNVGSAAASIDQYDRDSQAVVAVGIQGTATGAIVLGTYHFDYTIELRGMGTIVGT